MRTSWFKWLLVFAVLLVSSGGNAHAVSDHAMTRETPCSAHEHHHDGDRHHSHGALSHQDCCCSCFACPASLVTPIEPAAFRPVAYDLNLAPALASRLASRILSPELDPPKLSA